MATKKTEEIPVEQGPEMVDVKGLRNEDVAVIVNGEVRVIRKGETNLVEKRFADEFERAERAKDAFARNQQQAVENSEILAK